VLFVLACGGGFVATPTTTGTPTGTLSGPLIGGGVFLLLQAGWIAFRFSRAGSPFWRGTTFLAPLGVGALALALGIGTAPLAPTDPSAGPIAAISLLVLLAGMLTFAAVLLAPAPTSPAPAQAEPTTPAAPGGSLSPTLLAQLAEITAADAPVAVPEPARDREPAAV
jgi:hypothetical protein